MFAFQQIKKENNTHSNEKEIILNMLYLNTQNN